MSSKIRVLKDNTINQIAAGEVIENPGCVVKELVENSLDAGATEISVEIKGGGHQLIRVSDNGSGMTEDDALLCFERHATSKIRQLDDLQEITTMGFRGEAIPSIAAISKVTLITQTHSDQSSTEASMVIVDGGKILQTGPAARSPGTTIEVKSLFHNVPVRRKFQKSPNQDQGEILKTLSVIALGNPHVKFQLISNQETILLAPISRQETLQDQLQERISSVLGVEFSKTLSPIDFKQGDVTLLGYIGNPSSSRPNRGGQHLFINHRPVFSPLISSAVREGYGTTLAPNRYPTFVLQVGLPGDLVDVNVHPRKREVRLRQEQHLRAVLFQGIQEALQKSLGGQPRYVPQVSSTSLLQPLAFNALSDFDDHLSIYPPQQPAWPPNTQLCESPLQFSHTPIEDLPLITPKQTPSSPPRVLTTMNSYILVEIVSSDQEKQGIFIVDQRLAHSRILFEHLLRKEQDNAASDCSQELQSLLIPINYEASSLDATLLRDNIDQLNRMGIGIKDFGQNTFIIDALPTSFDVSSIETVIANLLEELRDFQSSKILQQDRERRLAVAATRSAISTEKRLSLDEAQRIVDELMRCQSPHHCPQGRPTMAHLSHGNIQQKFNLLVAR